MRTKFSVSIPCEWWWPVKAGRLKQETYASPVPSPKPRPRTKCTPVRTTMAVAAPDGNGERIRGYIVQTQKQSAPTDSCLRLCPRTATHPLRLYSTYSCSQCPRRIRSFTMARTRSRFEPWKLSGHVLPFPERFPLYLSISLQHTFLSGHTSVPLDLHPSFISLMIKTVSAFDAISNRYPEGLVRGLLTHGIVLYCSSM